MRIEQNVINVLEQCRIDDDKLYLPDFQLDRKLYMAVDKVLKLAGGKWNRSAKAHIFTADVGDAIDNIVLTGEVCDIKKELQYFPTPTAVIERLFSFVEIDRKSIVLEPSAGEGFIAKRLIELAGGVDTCEIHEPFSQSLLEMGCRIYTGDFLEFDNPKYYDFVIANPPFTRQQDIDHVNHMIDCCKGRVVSVMSGGTQWRENKKAVAFRERINSLGGYFVDLPDGSFKESGTMASTCIVVIDL